LEVQPAALRLAAPQEPPAEPHPQHLLRGTCFPTKEDQCFSQDYDDESDRDDPQPSDFVEHYKNSPEIYRKKLGFGTSWIGRRQYFSSVFVDAGRIEKQNLAYFVGGCGPEEDEAQVDRECVFDSEFESGNLLGAFKVVSSLGRWVSGSTICCCRTI
jgi:hypothetical protein